ncbi:aminotransferase class I/II-fold pyridoxal phosphate-dependent enzyme [Corallococcus sp. Z5C101001]|uniref:aminotransferase class I/II-fold pyridoxal phosphate-dependent enzyme n=1 Tax=Corallococcus sp. Z5C101001 TaxID=2596829 RepID=UPI0011809C50|nr:aminotransferase class I/II-fold pyridoxal phosphate-dependent enzyme [Corallococcus sp. Z5C101001]TSC31344.1 pyridoxal phosphate-dependent aminotransferase family protein [Corallococcus sp. Z5C101001]
MLDFTSALYLGLEHSSGSLAPWERLTLGTPAILEEPPGTQETSRALAELVGCERGLFARSTLHLFWDVFGALAGRPVAFYWDEGSYPVVRWGFERVVARGGPVRSFPHHSPEALARLLARAPRQGLRPVVVCDGWCPGCGALAPLDAYLEVVRAHGGLLILDDTQALGVFGMPGPGLPYGAGGGGSLRWYGIHGPDVLWCGSMAKALGVPMALMAGGARVVARYEERSETRMHCSPPSVADLHAAEHAVAINRRKGDALREALALRVAHFRGRLRRSGLSSVGGRFPVQRIQLPRGVNPRAVHERLHRRGIRTVLQRSRCGPEVSVSFILTARHGAEELTHAVEALVEAVDGRQQRRTRHE